MLKVVMILTLLFSQLAFSNEPPANYPLVKGVVRKIDASAGRITIKHEAIPNLDMPGMSMSFMVQDKEMLTGLTVGDQILFVADDIDGDIVVLWIGKAPQPILNISKLFCTGVAPTTPLTQVEIEINPAKYSTIRYEFIEGSYKGTAYINSIGRLKLSQQKDLFVYSTNNENTGTKLVFKKLKSLISEAYFSHYSSGMNNTPVNCSFE